MLKLKQLLAALAAGAILLTAGCQSAQAAANATDTADTVTITAQAETAQAAAVQLSAEAYSDRDLDASYDASEATAVDLSTVSGDYTINAAGEDRAVGIVAKRIGCIA